MSIYCIYIFNIILTIVNRSDHLICSQYYASFDDQKGVASRTVIIWGASGGIGRAVTRQLVEENWQVKSAGRQNE